MKTKLIVVGGAAAIAGVAVLATVRARPQPTSPTPGYTVSIATDEQGQATEPAQAQTPVESPDLTPIVHLEMQNKLVTVQSGPAGLVYLVQTKDGKVLHENLSEEQLKAQAPEIHDLIKTAVAGSGSKANSFMDARLGR
jgi:hypothetical protein